jgi:hypothetical protein
MERLVTVIAVTGFIAGYFVSRYFKSHNIIWITASFVVVGSVTSLLVVAFMATWSESSKERELRFQQARLRRTGYFNYAYKPLDKSDPQSIRLIELIALNEADVEGGMHMRIRMRVASLGDEDAPKYEALSYCWGDQSCLQPIICDDAVVLVTENLFMALYRVHLEGQNRTLWADALCIDQENLEEKTQQVRMMSEIYSNATQVLVYLGEVEDWSELLEEFIPKLSKAKDEIAVKVDYGYISFDQGISAKRQQELGIPFFTIWSIPNQSMFLALQKLFLREWFRRIWIVQEITLAQHATVFCGDWQLPWTSILAAYDMASLLSASGRDIIDLGFSRLKRLSWSKDNIDAPLTSLLFIHRGAGATDPRDHVYALLGLAGDGEDFEVDYGKPVAQLYCDVARQILSSADSLVLLNTAGKTRHRSDLLLPSWVPDWRADIRCKPLWSEFTENAVEPEFTVDFTVHGSQLNLYGVEIDCVDQLGICFPSLRNGQEYGPWYELRYLSSIYRCIITFQPLSTTPYPVGEASALDIFWKVLIGEESLFYQELQSSKWGRIQMSTASWVTSLPVSTNSMWQQILAFGLFYIPVVWVLILCRHYKSWHFVGRSNYPIGRRMFRTETNYIGLAPEESQTGDRVFLLQGGRSPMMLRQSIINQDAYELVGECYLHGLMDKQPSDVAECYKISIV